MRIAKGMTIQDLLTPRAKAKKKAEKAEKKRLKAGGAAAGKPDVDGEYCGLCAETANAVSFANHACEKVFGPRRLVREVVPSASCCRCSCEVNAVVSCTSTTYGAC